MSKARNNWQALKKWYALSPELRKKIESNVFCVSCCGVTTIVNYTVSCLEPGIVLQGTCKKCGGRVNRVIEAD